MHFRTPARLVPSSLSGLRNRIQQSPAATVVSLLPGEHGKRNSEDEQSSDNRPEAAPTPRRLAVVGSRCCPVPHGDRKGIA